MYFPPVISQATPDHDPTSLCSAFAVSTNLCGLILNVFGWTLCSQVSVCMWGSEPKLSWEFIEQSLWYPFRFLYGGHHLLIPTLESYFVYLLHAWVSWFSPWVITKCYRLAFDDGRQFRFIRQRPLPHFQLHQNVSKHKTGTPPVYIFTRFK